MPRLAANLSILFTERPFLERFAAAVAAGFRAVQCHSPYDMPEELVRAHLQRTGLTMLDINTSDGMPGDRDSGLAAVPGRQIEARARIEQAISCSAAIGGSALPVTAGEGDPKDAAVRAAFADNLAYAAELAAPRGLTILIEPPNGRGNPRHALPTVEQAAALIDCVGRANLRLQFDAYHVQIGQGDVFTRLRMLLPLIGHVQIAAVPSRAEADEGELDCAAFGAELDRLGYGGWVGAEYHPRGRTEDGIRWTRRMVRPASQMRTFVASGSGQIVRGTDQALAAFGCEQVQPLAGHRQADPLPAFGPRPGIGTGDQALAGKGEPDQGFVPGPLHHPDLSGAAGYQR